MAYRCVKNHFKECDGCMCCQEEKDYYCPQCGEKVFEDVYVSNEGEIVGCENCISLKSVWEILPDDDDDETEW